MRLIISSILFLVSGLVQAAVMYSYTGNNYDSVTNYAYLPPPEATPYDYSMSISGNVVFSEELARSTIINAQWLSDHLVSYSFSDGVNNLNQDNSQITFGEFVADTGGTITQWGINIVYAVQEPGDPEVSIFQRISTGMQGFSASDYVKNYECHVFSGGACYDPSFDHYAQTSQSPGTWVASSVVPIPAAAWLFGSALAGLGFVRKRVLGP